MYCRGTGADRFFVPAVEVHSQKCYNTSAENEDPRMYRASGS